MPNWDSKLLKTLWAYRTTYKMTTKFTPFRLVYSQEVILPIELELPLLRNATKEHLRDKESFQERIAMLEHLDEVRNQAYLNMAKIHK